MANNDQDIPPPPPPPVPGGSGLNRQQPWQNQPAVQGNNDAAQLARQIQANTNVTMKTEISMESRERTPLLRSNSWHASMNAKSPTNGTT